MTINKKLMFAAVAAALLPGVSIAQDVRTEGYLTDTTGRIVMSGTNLCWRHRDMDMPSATGPCEMKAPVAIIPAAAPMVVAAAKPAAPVAKVAQKPAPQKISFSGDALFAFDKAVLKPEGKVMLDGLVTQLSGATYDNIQATGHTDRFGSNAYNQKLSERRANRGERLFVEQRRDGEPHRCAGQRRNPARDQSGRLPRREKRQSGRLPAA